MRTLRIGRYFLLLALLVSVVGASGTIRAQKNVTIKWWDFPRPWADPAGDTDANAWNAKLVKQYQDSHPGVTIEFTPVSWVDGPRKLDVAVAAGDAPDVMYGFPALFGRMLALGVLAPVDSKLKSMSESDLKDYFPAAM